MPEGAKARIGKGRINEIAYSPDGGQLAVATSIGIWIYSIVTGDEVKRITGNLGIVFTISFSRDGLTLASGSSDGRILLWDAQTWEY